MARRLLMGALDRWPREQTISETVDGIKAEQFDDLDTEDSLALLAWLEQRFRERYPAE